MDTSACSRSRRSGRRPCRRRSRCCRSSTARRPATRRESRAATRVRRGSHMRRWCAPRDRVLPGLGRCGVLEPPRVNRRRIDSNSVVPSRRAAAYLTIWSYCWAINSHRIGRVNTGPSCPYASVSPGRYRRMEPMFFNRGSSRNPSSSIRRARPPKPRRCRRSWPRSRRRCSAAAVRRSSRRGRRGREGAQ